MIRRLLSYLTDRERRLDDRLNDLFKADMAAGRFRPVIRFTLRLSWQQTRRPDGRFGRKRLVVL